MCLSPVTPIPRGEENSTKIGATYDYEFLVLALTTILVDSQLIWLDSLRATRLPPPCLISEQMYGRLSFNPLLRSHPLPFTSSLRSLGTRGFGAGFPDPGSLRSPLQHVEQQVSSELAVVNAGVSVALQLSLACSELTQLCTPTATRRAAAGYTLLLLAFAVRLPIYGDCRCFCLSSLSLCFLRFLYCLSVVAFVVSLPPTLMLLAFGASSIVPGVPG